MRTFVRLTFVLLTLLVAGCGAEHTANSGEVVVVATTTILGDLSSNVVGEDATVIVLMPIGADPHDFRPSAAQVAAINDADLVVANGLFLEEGLEDVLEAASDDGVNVLEVGERLDPLPFDGDHEGDHEEEGDDEHGSLDPHFWFDPLRLAEAASVIAEELSVIAPDTDWMSRAQSYAQTLAATDEEIIEMLSDIPESRRRIVTSHGSLGYFADRYDFDVIGTVIPAGSTVASPSSDELAALVHVMRSEGVSVIFGETTQPELLARAVAAELGQEVEVVSLYTGSLGEPGTGAETLIGLLRTNATRITEALDG